MASISFKANIGKVQELKFSNDGKARLQFTAAEGHRGKVNGEWADTGTTWYSVTVFGADAEDLSNVLVAGAKQRVTVAGRLSSRKYQATDGTERESLDVVADFVGIAPVHGTAGAPRVQHTGDYANPGRTEATGYGNFGDTPAADPWGAPGSNTPAWSANTDSAPF